MSRLQQDNTMRDQRRGEDLKNLKWQELQSANLASEERSEAKRFIRRMQQEDREREMEEALTKVCSCGTAEKQHCFVILLFPLYAIVKFTLHNL